MTLQVTEKRTSVRCEACRTTVRNGAKLRHTVIETYEMYLCADVSACRTRWDNTVGVTGG